MINKNKIVLGIVVFGCCTIALFYFLGMNDFSRSAKIGAALFILVLSLIVFLIKEIKRRRDIAKSIVVEDELTIKLKAYAGNKAFQISMILWIIIFVLQDLFADTKTLLGLGILGSALIYGICLWYFKNTHHFNDESL